MTLEEVIPHLEETYHSLICTGLIDGTVPYVELYTFKDISVNELVHIKFLLQENNYRLSDLGAVDDELKLTFIGERI